MRDVMPDIGESSTFSCYFQVNDYSHEKFDQVYVIESQCIIVRKKYLVHPSSIP